MNRDRHVPTPPEVAAAHGGDPATPSGSSLSNPTETTVPRSTSSPAGVQPAERTREQTRPGQSAELPLPTVIVNRPSRVPTLDAGNAGPPPLLTPPDEVPAAFGGRKDSEGREPVTREPQRPGGEPARATPAEHRPKQTKTSPSQTRPAASGQAAAQPTPGASPTADKANQDEPPPAATDISAGSGRGDGGRSDKRTGGPGDPDDPAGKSQTPGEPDHSVVARPGQPGTPARSLQRESAQDTTAGRAANPAATDGVTDLAEEATGDTLQITLREVPNRDIVAEVITPDRVGRIEVSRATIEGLFGVVAQRVQETNKGTRLLTPEQETGMRQKVEELRDRLFSDKAFAMSPEAITEVREKVATLLPFVTKTTDDYKVRVTQDLINAEQTKESLENGLNAVDIEAEQEKLLTVLSRGQTPGVDSEAEPAMQFMQDTYQRLHGIVDVINGGIKEFDGADAATALDAEILLWFLDAYMTGAQLAPEKFREIYERPDPIDPENPARTRMASLPPPGSKEMGGFHLYNFTTHQLASVYDANKKYRPTQVEAERRAGLISELVLLGMRQKEFKRTHRDIAAQKGNSFALRAIQTKYNDILDALNPPLQTINDHLDALGDIAGDMYIGELAAADGIIKNSASEVRGSGDMVITRLEPLATAEAYVTEAAIFHDEIGAVQFRTAKLDRDTQKRLNRLKERPINGKLSPLVEARDAQEKKVELNADFKQAADTTADMLRGRFRKDHTANQTAGGMAEALRILDPDWKMLSPAERGILITLATDKFELTTLTSLKIALDNFDQGGPQLPAYRKAAPERYNAIADIKRNHPTYADAFLASVDHIDRLLSERETLKLIISNLLGGGDENALTESARRLLSQGKHIDPVEEFTTKIVFGLTQIEQYLKTEEILLPNRLQIGQGGKAESSQPDGATRQERPESVPSEFPAETYARSLRPGDVDLSEVDEIIIQAIGGEQIATEIEGLRQLFDSVAAFRRKDLFAQWQYPANGYENMSSQELEQRKQGTRDIDIRPVRVPLELKKIPSTATDLTNTQVNQLSMEKMGAKAQEYLKALGKIPKDETTMFFRLAKAAADIAYSMNENTEDLISETTAPDEVLGKAALILENLQRIVGWLPNEKTIKAVHQIVNAELGAQALLSYYLGFKKADEDTKNRFQELKTKISKKIGGMANQDISPDERQKFTNMIAKFRSEGQKLINEANRQATPKDPDMPRTNTVLKGDLDNLESGPRVIDGVEQQIDGIHKALTIAVTKQAIDTIYPLLTRLQRIQTGLRQYAQTIDVTSEGAREQFELLAQIEDYIEEHATHVLINDRPMGLDIPESVKEGLQKLQEKPMQAQIDHWDELQSQLTPAEPEQPVELTQNVRERAQRARAVLKADFHSTREPDQRKQAGELMRKHSQDGLTDMDRWLLVQLATGKTGLRGTVDGLDAVAEVSSRFVWQDGQIEALQNTAQMDTSYATIKTFVTLWKEYLDTHPDKYLSAKEYILQSVMRLQKLSARGIAHTLAGKDAEQSARDAIAQKLTKGLVDIRDYLETGRIEPAKPVEVYSGDLPEGLKKNQEGTTGQQAEKAHPAPSPDQPAPAQTETEQLESGTPEPVADIRINDEPEETGEESQLVTISAEDLQLMQSLFGFGFRVSGTGIRTLQKAWTEEQLLFDPLRPMFTEVPPEDIDKLKNRIKKRYSERQQDHTEKSPQRVMLDRIDWLYKVKERFNGKVFQPNKPILGGSYLVCLIEYQGRNLAILETPLTGNATYMIPEELIEVALQTQQPWDAVAEPYRKTEALAKGLAIKTNHIPVPVTDGSRKSYDQHVMETHDLRVFDDVDSILAEIRGTEAPTPRYQTERPGQAEQTSPREKLSLDPYLDTIIALNDNFSLDPGDERVQDYFRAGGAIYPNKHDRLFEIYFARKEENLSISQVENFARLFRQHRLVTQNSELEINHDLLTIAERTGDKWETFLRVGEGVIKEMAPILDMLEQYDALRNFRTRLSRNNDQEQLTMMNDLIGHPLGVEAYGIAIYDKLYPLLDQAYVYMKQIAKIDPARFYDRRSVRTIRSPYL